MSDKRQRATLYWPAAAIAVLLMLLVAAGVATYCIHHTATVVVPNAYALDWVSAMICEYMKAHDGKWPRGWDDLQVPYDKLLGPQNYPWSFDELRQRVAIDWNADPTRLAAFELTDGEPPFRVIWLRDGRRDYYEGDDPNLRILRFLKTGRGGYGYD